MSERDTPDKAPEPQSQRGDGPPEPPKSTAQSFDEDDSEREKRMRAFFEFEQARKDSARLVEILGYLRESSWQAAINRLEADLDASVVALSDGLLLMPEKYRPQLAEGFFRDILRYRIVNPRKLTGDGKLRDRAQQILDEFNQT